jgi:hypothetical protein
LPCPRAPVGRPGEHVRARHGVPGTARSGCATAVTQALLPVLLAQPMAVLPVTVAVSVPPRTLLGDTLVCAGDVENGDGPPPVILVSDWMRGTGERF